MIGRVTTRRARFLKQCGRARLIALILTSVPLITQAWDVKTAKPEWHSIYLSSEERANEHTAISQDALIEMGAGAFTGAPGHPWVGWEVKDLNASLLRRDDLLYKETVVGERSTGDRRSTEAEERLLPAPAQFSGMPDYAYAIHDWINKQTFCPALPDDETISRLSRRRCHAFKGWMGALNSNHFGSQARAAYLHFHGIALRLARRVQQRRATMSAAEKRAWSAALREAELEALSYEGFAQHFLADRWSSGHMWERWNAPGYAELPKKTLLYNLFVGAITGVLHGAEGVTGIPDPLCSPQLRRVRGVGRVASPVQYQAFPAAAGTSPVDAVGDYRYDDMRLDLYRPTSRTAYPMSVSTHHDAMMECVKRGWAETIRALGPADSQPGGARRFGSWEIPLNDSAPAETVSVSADSCWNVWATNESMYAGWNSPITSSSATIAGLSLFGAAGLTDDELTGQLSREIRIDLIQMHHRLWAAARNPATAQQTTMARGALGSLGPANMGNAYTKLPNYYEPANMDADLPNFDRSNGRDKAAVFGFFSRAHADYWCLPESYDVDINPLRGSADPIAQEICRFVVDFAVSGTDASYQGRQVFRPTLPDGSTYRGYCAIAGVSGSGGDYPDFVHPGYVPYPRPEGDEVSIVGHVVENWCDRVPVIDVNSADLAAVAQLNPNDTVRIRGRHFGTRPGTLLLESGAGIERLDVLSWSDSDITFRLSPITTPLDATAEFGFPHGMLKVRREDGEESPGLALLRLSQTTVGTPEIVDLRFDAPPPFEPGEIVDVIADVWDGDGTADLRPGFVTVTSPIFSGGQLTLNFRRVIDQWTAEFRRSVAIKKPLNDLSQPSCPVTDYELRAIATDSAVVGATHSSPPVNRRIGIENVAPALTCNFDLLNEDPIEVDPGDPLQLVVGIDDFNHDLVCRELSVDDVTLTDAMGLSTRTPLSRAAKTQTSNARRDWRVRFDTSVNSPHPDNDDRGDVPFVTTIAAADDRGLGLRDNPDCPGATNQRQLRIVVRNVAPQIIDVRVRPRAIHPNQPTPVTFRIEAGDNNTAADINQLLIDMTQFGEVGRIVDLGRQLNNTGANGVWTYTAVVTMAQGQRTAFIQAVDDDGLRTPRVAAAVVAQNFAPEWQGGGFLLNSDRLDFLPPERAVCPQDTIILGTIFTDRNEDTLEVKAEIEHLDTGAVHFIRMDRQPGTNNYVISFPAFILFEGLHEVYFTAAELGTHPQKLVSTEYCCSIEVLPAEECELRDL